MFQSGIVDAGEIAVRSHLRPRQFVGERKVEFNAGTIDKLGWLRHICLDPSGGWQRQ
jgi:hypothetical protein